MVTPPEGFEELSRWYLARCREETAPLWTWLASGTYDQIQRVAHNIKGTGLSYGFAQLTNMGRVLEQAAKAGDLERMRHSLEALGSYLKAVKLKGDPAPTGSTPPSVD